MFSSRTNHGRRTIRDLAGTVWHISERDARDIPGAVELTCLIFDSQAICRRYWHFPADWNSFDDERLLGLMQKAR